MKNKKFRSIISFLLCLVLLFSLPLNTTAHAVAIESWVIYALITYMTALGITFTVAGGVDAMVQAMEEKVADYETATGYKLFEVIQGGASLQPPPPDPGDDPNWNPNKLYLFFKSNVALAIAAFIEWLVNDGGWSLGSEQSDELTFATWEAYQTVGDAKQYYTCTNTFVDTVESASYGGKTYYRAKIINLGTNRVIKTSDDYQSVDSLGYNLRIYYGSPYYYNNIYLNGNFSSQSKIDIDYLKRAFNYSGTTDEFLGDYKMAFAFRDGLLYNGLVVDDGYFYYCNEMYRGLSKTVSELSSEIRIPLEIPEFKPLPTEGILLNQDFIGSPDLIEWSNWVEETFTDTGTIPQPNPQIVQDPDYAPEPTPAPTPVPSPEIEDIDDLGLPQLGEALFNKFPFSLPKDIARVFAILHADPVPPYWEVDLTSGALGIESNFVIDLEPYETIGQVCRWVSVISFSLFLILITKGMIGW